MGLLRWEKHVGIIWVNDGREVLIVVGHGVVSRFKLPSVNLEGGNSRVGSDGRNLPSDVTSVRVGVGSEQVHGASIVRTFGVGRPKRKADGDGLHSGITTENSSDNAHVDIVGSPT